jgi:ELWxxDGT repeat protein
LTALGDLLVFAAGDGVHGWEPWRSDGTEAGTFMLRDVYPGPESSSYFDEIVASGDLAYFAGDDGVHGTEMWRTDGTAAGTVMVKDLSPGPDSSYPYALTDVTGTLFFFGYDTHCDATQCVSTHSLYRSDGTAAGTVAIGSVSWFPDPFEEWWPFYMVAAVGDTLYFTSQDGTHGFELWKSDGTWAGTEMVKDIRPGPKGSFPYHLTAVGDTLYFEANDGKHGTELWRSDGTSTSMVKDIAPGHAHSLGEWLDLFGAVGQALYFTPDDGTHGIELWRTDGTRSGTRMVSDLHPGARGSFPAWLVAFGDRLLFTAKTPSTGRELWAT